MKLWLLKRKDHVGYDEAEGFVVRAERPSAARKLANSMHGDEGDAWLDPERTSCQCLFETGNADILLRAFNPG